MKYPKGYVSKKVEDRRFEQPSSDMESPSVMMVAFARSKPRYELIKPSEAQVESVLESLKDVYASEGKKPPFTRQQFKNILLSGFWLEKGATDGITLDGVFLPYHIRFNWDALKEDEKTLLRKGIRDLLLKLSRIRALSQANDLEFPPMYEWLEQVGIHNLAF